MKELCFCCHKYLAYLPCKKLMAQIESSATRMRRGLLPGLSQVLFNIWRGPATSAQQESGFLHLLAENSIAASNQYLINININFAC
ncbi:hypothetical protein KQH34_02725 [Erwinia amylovora]|uniref:Uncharacterized protein n=5 Tax=Erwinia amylovora TaxID=552 RepID=A0A830ZS91_ERWAM|nr:hypothetical protein AD997_07250 [Erwinia amylovora]EKV54130.1 hypothetical protein EaACW_1431 [Erwinia amylovora ACW56400]CBA20375.1 hypothetical protein predicted by Glimmer/Critica [Erwinia amylovora CFBP1430]CCO78279.1 hypothetical protein BN432_1475 [Erwinia amylovora Ea356]CCO82068.1 hypothetical protein BN433_1490 [Erwinia amylovora Ea266]CCO85864.1 hypothetical protein BN434_1470 [Erwinia amylovora CFBP 2585]CCO89651.1 hypothetical protein BN435_1473 [Erwinia amylovora 01SFR-BO]CC